MVSSVDIQDLYAVMLACCDPEVLSNLESLRDRFPAACGVDFMDERLYPQEPQCNGVDVPHRISGEVPTSGV